MKTMNTIKRICLVLASVMLFASFSFAQSGEIKGKLINANGDSLPFASVLIIAGNTQLGTVADMHGYYRLRPLESGYYTIVFSYLQEVDTVYKIKVNPGKITKMRDIIISNLMVELVVDGGEVFDPLIQPDGGSEDIITSKDIDALETGSIIDIIDKVSPKITKTGNGDVYVRGSREGDMVYYVDGVRRTTNPVLPQGTVKSIIVYAGGVPASYGDFMGGVIVVETKTYNDWIIEKKSRDFMTKRMLDDKEKWQDESEEKLTM